MEIKELRIQHFRGFADLDIKPAGHVVVMGEPRSGRSDLIEAIGCILDAEAGRYRVTTELDFHGRDTGRPIVVTLTLGGLGEDLEQRFLQHLDLWDSKTACLVSEADDAADIDDESYEWALRLGYTASWLSDEERCEEKLFYPKESDLEAGAFVGPSRREIRELGFNALNWSNARILDLGPRGNFRRLINRVEGGDFASAVATYMDTIAQAATKFTEASQVETALEQMMSSLHGLPAMSGTGSAQLFQFTPEGGSPSGLLRSLGPAIDFGDAAGSFPAWRQGSTTVSLLRVAEALALAQGTDAILAFDDLGDGMDAATATHFASVIRRFSGQAWVTTRLPAVAEVFEPQEVVRLGKDDDDVRFVRQGKQPLTKADNVASKHWHRSLLPALSYRAVIVVEGPNDFAALHSLALRLFNEQDVPLPATRGVAIINAGATGGGGYANVLKLASNAKEIGLRTVAAVDGDRKPDAKKSVETNISLSDVVVRLPEGYAIERAMVDGISDRALKQAIKDVASGAGLPAPDKFDRSSVVSFLKRNSLHGPFIDALPADDLPSVAVKYLGRMLQAATGTDKGLIEL